MENKNILNHFQKNRLKKEKDINDRFQYKPKQKVKKNKIKEYNFKYEISK